MWVYAQRTGNMFHRLGAAVSFLTKGYSGRGDGENNPAKQCESDFGPVPQGRYLIRPPIEFNHMQDCLRLVPDPGNEMCGRSGFWIHDGVFTGPHGDTSHGCICMHHAARLVIWGSDDHELLVQEDDLVESLIAQPSPLGAVG
jgi:hypothetical protein